MGRQKNKRKCPNCGRTLKTKKFGKSVYHICDNCSNDSDSSQVNAIIIPPAQAPPKSRLHHPNIQLQHPFIEVTVEKRTELSNKDLYTHETIQTKQNRFK